MIQQLNFDEIPQISLMKKTPKHIFAIGNVDLLSKKKVSIVGTRKPTQYTIELTHQISAKLASNNIVVVSGAAMGVDAVAHKAAGCSNTIAVAGTGLDIRYPAINKTLIENISKILKISEYLYFTNSKDSRMTDKTLRAIKIRMTLSNNKLKVSCFFPGSMI